MGRHTAVIGIGFLALALIAGLSGWLLFGAATPTATGWSLGPLWLYVAGGLVLVVVLAGFLTWLTSYSATHRDGDRRDEP